MWNGLRVAVVLPTYNEKESIAAFIRAFESLGIIDDILVVNNNAAEGTSEVVRTTTAREVLEPVQGYGSAVRRGLAETRDADLVCICEPDGTFDAEDLHKLLPFTVECGIVFGSRTVTHFIWEGANMGLFLRWGNWAVAKLLELLYNTVYLSDVGCTFRVISRPLIDAMEPHFQGTGSSFGLEMMVLAVCSGQGIVQVPVNYRPRVGQSSVTGDFSKAFSLGLEMMSIIVRNRRRRATLRTAMIKAVARNSLTPRTNTDPTRDELDLRVEVL
ncbi:MAG: glycosyltransferase family 2 protein [Acidimicrobiia bacterium]